MTEFKPLETNFKNVNEAFEAAAVQYPDNVEIAYYYQGKETIFT